MRFNKETIAIFFASVGTFPMILVLSSFKLMLNDFSISLAYKTILSYIGILGAFRIIFSYIVNNTTLPFFTKKLSIEKNWIFLGQILMTLGLFGCIWTKNLFFLMGLTMVVVIGECLQDTGMSGVIVTFNKKEKKSLIIFLAHKLSALIGFFLFPYLGGFISWNFSLIVMTILSFFLSFFVFFLPNSEDANEINNDNSSNEKNKENLSSIVKKTINQISQSFFSLKKRWLIIIFIILFNGALLILHGIHPLLLLKITKSRHFVYSVRGWNVLIGAVGGIMSKLGNKKKKVHSLVIASLFHLVIMILHYISFIYVNKVLFLGLQIAENFIKGFMMMTLTDFFLSKSEGEFKRQRLTLFWGIFQLVRSFFGGFAGVMYEKLELQVFFWVLILLAIFPIFISKKLQNINN